MAGIDVCSSELIWRDEGKGRKIEKDIDRQIDRQINTLREREKKKIRETERKKERKNCNQMIYCLR